MDRDRAKKLRAELWAKWYTKAKNDPAWIEARRAKKRAAYRINPEIKKASDARSYAVHKEARLASQKAYRQSNLELVRQRERSRKRSPELHSIYNKRYQSKPAVKLKKAAIQRKRVALQFAVTIEPVDYAAVVAQANGMCGICKMALNGESAHIDHIIPLSRGGSHAQDNLQLSHARCNIKKGARLFMKAG